MKVVCLDDEYLILQRTVSILRRFPQVESVEGFSSSAKLLEYLKNNPVDVAFLDINMPDMSGLVLAQMIRDQSSQIELVFLTGYNEYALEAFKVHAAGYLIKPVEEEDLLAEIQNIERMKNDPLTYKVKVVTFGNFDLLVNGKMIAFSRSKAKEILAYLITKKGTGVSRAELASILWEEDVYDHSKQKQLDVYIRSLSNTLRDHGIEYILEKNRGVLRVIPDRIDCDYYKYLDGDAEAIKSFAGEFMNSYSWAEYLKEVFIKRLKE